MTSKRLEEIRKKFSAGEGTNEELCEILSDLFVSNSNHLKEIKAEILELKENQKAILESLEDIVDGLNPVYTIIQDEDN